MMKERKHEKAQVEIIRGSRDGTKKGIEELESDIAYENTLGFQICLGFGTKIEG